MKEKFKNFHSGRAVFFLMVFIVVIIGIGVLKLAASIILPFTIALLLTFVMEPLVNLLKRFRIPRIIAILLTVFIILSGIYFLGMILFSSGRTLLTLYPKYESRMMEIYSGIANIFQLPYDEQLSVFENVWGQLGIRNWMRNATFTLSNSFFAFLKDAFIMVFILVFLLLEATYIQKKIDLAFETKMSGQIKNMTKAITRQVTRYLSIKFFISVLNGVLVGIIFALIGVEFPLLWGTAQFILNFIPTIGSLVFGIVAVVFTLLQFWPDLSYVLIVALVLIVMNIVLGSFLDPKITGDNLGLSPLVVLVSLFVWGWIWGFAGMILAVPMTVIVKIACENIEFLEPVSILLSSKKIFAVKRAEPVEAPAPVQSDGES